MICKTFINKLSKYVRFVHNSIITTVLANPGESIRTIIESLNHRL